MLTTVLVHTHLLIALSLCLLATSDDGAQQQQRQALIAFYNATNGSHWNPPSSSWDVANGTANYCEWRGVTCPNTGSVQSLDLENMRLFGTLTPDLANLTSLENLQLSNNLLTGTIPKEYSTWPRIVFFNVSFNSLSGTLPNEFALWKSIGKFDVNTNALTGTMPASYGNWSTANSFNVSVNKLSGTLPSNFSNWISVGAFGASYNSLTGTLPSSYSSMTLLSLFILTNNSLSGIIPENYSTWSQIHTFSVQFNNLTGTLPVALGSSWRGSLSVFAARSNRLTGTLPPEYGNWSSVTLFQVADNPLTGTLPPIYGTSWKSIDQIVIFLTNISGTIPDTWGAMTTITIMQLFQNKLNGTLPASFGNFTKLQTLLLALNEFEGTVPVQAWAKLRKVQQIVLQDNPRLQGRIPTSWNSIMIMHGIISICRTEMCGPLLSSTQGYGCVPVSIFPQLATMTVAQSLTLVSQVKFQAFVTCKSSSSLSHTPFLTSPTRRRSKYTSTMSRIKSTAQLPPAIAPLKAISSTKVSTDRPAGNHSLSTTTTQTLSLPEMPSISKRISVSPFATESLCRPQGSAATLSKSIERKDVVNLGSSIISSLVAPARDANTAMAAAVLLGGVFLGDGGSGLGSVQMLSSVMSSTCMCQDAVASAQRMTYTTSPFWDLGLIAVVLGNIGCVVGIGVCHSFITAILAKITSRASECPHQTFMERFLAMSSSLRFPGMSLRFSLFFVPGVVKGSTFIFFFLIAER